MGLSEKSGPRRAAVRRGTEAQPLRQGRSKTPKHPWQGVLRLYLVSLSLLPSAHMPQWRSHEWTDDVVNRLLETFARSSKENPRVEHGASRYRER